ncbi:MAG: response regulator [Patescibacteria group bacterium]|jgi:two-component system response regulator ResD|nr:response regulator [Patescibacteria group bacterium]
MSDVKNKILIVEDYATLRILLAKKLSKEGFVVEQAQDGETALEKIPTFRPNVILLDIMMPGIDGYEVLKQVRHNDDAEIAAIPVIMLSNLGDDDDIKKAMVSGADDYMIKSNITADDVIEKIKIYQ